MNPELTPIPKIPLEAVNFPDNVVYMGTIATHVGNPDFNRDLPSGVNIDEQLVNSLDMVGRQMFVEHYERIEDPAARSFAVIVANWVERSPTSVNAWIAFKLLDTPERRALHRDIQSGALSCLSISLVVKTLEHRETSIVSRPRIDNAYIRLRVETEGPWNVPDPRACAELLKYVRSLVDLTRPLERSAKEIKIKKKSPGARSFGATRVYLLSIPAWSRYIPVRSELNRFSTMSVQSSEEDGSARDVGQVENEQQSSESGAKDRAVVADKMDVEVSHDPDDMEVDKLCDSFAALPDDQKEGILKRLIKQNMVTTRAQNRMVSEVIDSVGEENEGLREQLRSILKLDPVQHGFVKQAIVDLYNHMAGSGSSQQQHRNKRKQPSQTTPIIQNSYTCRRFVSSSVSDDQGISDNKRHKTAAFAAAKLNEEAARLIQSIWPSG